MDDFSRGLLCGALAAGVPLGALLAITLRIAKGFERQAALSRSARWAHLVPVETTEEVGIG